MECKDAGILIQNESYWNYLPWSVLSIMATHSSLICNIYGPHVKLKFNLPQQFIVKQIQCIERGMADKIK